ncbi:LytR C-terminal domain-containing protein [Bifidobacterium thermophilum]|uniref:LytR C-terminal domain-containing protein n=1 Tax=Bifidobacterium thermophilum TaxID=33905 RepID=UPI0030B5ABE1
MTGIYDERVARKAYVRRRQTTVFSITVVCMVVALVVSLLFYFHAFGLGKPQTAESLPNHGVTVACAVPDSSGTAKYVDTSTVHVRVLNGTQHSGFARAVGEALTNRGFTVESVANYQKTDVKRTVIYYGRNTVNEAYTLNDHFTDAVMKMDDRQDKLIDVVLGATFDNLKTKSKVLGKGAKITSISGCVDSSKMTNLPKALTHDAVS